MRNVVKSYIKTCIECAYNKHEGGKKEVQYHFDPMEPVPFKTVHIDHLGPFPKTSRRNEHILVIVDSFTKYTVIRPVKNTSTKFVLAEVNEMFNCFGTPQRIVTDRGTAFTSKDFARYCHDNSIKHILNAVRTPRANGHAERANRTILSMLLPTVTNEKQWDQYLSRIQWSLNTMRNATTGRTPQELLFSFTPRDTLQNKVLLALSDDFIRDAEFPKGRLEEAAERVTRQRQAAKERYDRRHATPRRYEEGNLVLVQREAVATGTSRKLEPKYKGPFIVTRVLDNDRYVLEDLPQTTRTSRHYSSVHASDRMKLWCQLPDKEEEDLTYTETNPTVEDSC